MADTLQTKALDKMAVLHSQAIALGKLLDDHRCNEVVVMDMRTLDYWTDFFVIATVTSDTHLRGLHRHIKDFVEENDLEILRRSRRPEKLNNVSSDEWSLLDLGGIVIHLMTEKARSFFELERLWNAAPLIYEAKLPQSSKSS